MKIGFIGLGSMGEAMALNALKAGHSLQVWNRSREATKLLAAQGATVVDTPAEAFASDAVFTMLADDAALRAVLIDSNLLQNARKGLIHVNMATVSVAFCDELVKLHEKYDISYVAAPVIGRPDAAAKGSLNILAAGSDNDIDCVQPVFDVIGQKTWRLGNKPQNANLFKLTANFMLMAAIESTGEALSLISAYGVDQHAFLEVIANTLFPGLVYKNYGQMIADNRYEPALFTAKLGLKDVKLAIAAAEAMNVTLPVASLVRNNLIEVMAHGNGDNDLAVLGEIASRHAGRKT